MEIPIIKLLSILGNPHSHVQRNSLKILYYFAMLEYNNLE
jgi:hypothetical protein